MSEVEKEEERQAFLTPRKYLSIESGIEQAGFGWSQYKILISAATVFLTAVQAAHLGSLILPNVSCEWGLKKKHVLILLGTGSLAMTLGAFIGNFTCHALGRRKNIIGGLVMMLVSGIMSVTQQNFACYLIFRAISFASFQFVSSSGVCAVVEVSPSSARLPVNAVLTVAGQMGATCSAFVAMTSLHIVGWRNLMIILYIPCLLPLILFILLDDSPKHLIRSGKPGEGRAALSKMFKDNSSEDLSHLITWSRCQVEKRKTFGGMFAMESEKTTTVLLAVMTVKNLVITTFHTAIPYILEGDYNIYRDRAPLESKCLGISPGTLGSLAKGHVINILITMSAVSFSQLVGRTWSAFLCFTAATTALLINILWLRGQQGVLLQMTMANCLVQGARILIVLLLQEMYPPSYHGAMGEFLLSLGHTINTAAPYLTVYVAVRREVKFFVVYTALFGAMSVLLLCARYLANGDNSEKERLYSKGFVWELGGYDSD